MVRVAGPDHMSKDGNSYHQCTFHKCWSFHKDSECKGCLKSASTSGAGRTPPSPQASPPISYAATFVATMAALKKKTPLPLIQTNDGHGTGSLYNFRRLGIKGPMTCVFQEFPFSPEDTPC